MAGTAGAPFTGKPIMFLSYKSLAAIACVASLAAPAGAARAQQAPPDAAPVADVIEITANRDPELRPYRDMLRGLDAFEAQHRLAPKAALRFRLVSAAPGTDIAHGRLSIEGSLTSIPVPIAADGTFVLPRIDSAGDGDAQLVLNRKKDSVGWRPDIRTPGLAANVRRLGDLRLECEVRWAIEKPRVPLLMRLGVSALGGPCNSANVNVVFIPPKPVAAARLIDPATGKASTETIRLVDGGRRFVPPLHKQHFGDDTLIEFDYLADDAGMAARAGQ